METANNILSEQTETAGSIEKRQQEAQETLLKDGIEEEILEEILDMWVFIHC